MLEEGFCGMILWHDTDAMLSQSFEGDGFLNKFVQEVWGCIYSARELAR